jgi:uncharacterized Zn-finger protein
MTTEAASLPMGPELVRVKTPVVSCDGCGSLNNSRNNSGHPLVYLTLGEKGHTTCPYCRRKFILIEEL